MLNPLKEGHLGKLIFSESSACKYVSVETVYQCLCAIKT